jgi:hypothetical protein
MTVETEYKHDNNQTTWFNKLKQKRCMVLQVTINVKRGRTRHINKLWTFQTILILNTHNNFWSLFTSDFYHHAHLANSSTLKPSFCTPEYNLINVFGVKVSHLMTNHYTTEM